jgi:low affinity Fe/Cu permease
MAISARNESKNGREKNKKSPDATTIRSGFRSFAHCTAEAVGSPWAFAAATVIILAWAITGPIFHYSDTWQLVINTSTTIVTFLMVFLIQNTQNRDARAMHLKLDELIRSISGARNHLVDLEDLTDDELDHLQQEFQRLRKNTRHDESQEVLEDVAEDVEEEKEERQERTTKSGT